MNALDAAERCVAAERREQALQLRLNAADQRIDELTQPAGETVWCACGDGHAANSYGAGFMDANNGVCVNCDAAGGGCQEPVLIQAVAVTREGDDGMYLEWLLEGGICELELPGTMLFALPEANDLCDEDGSAEIYTSPPASLSVVVDEREEFVVWVRREWPQAPLSNVRDLLPKGDPRHGEYCDETLQRAWVGWQARAALARNS